MGRRLFEKARYLAANGPAAEAAQRWRAYEDLILDRYLTEGDVKKGLTRKEALAVVWRRRNRRAVATASRN